MKKIVALILAGVILQSCGSGKHTNCDAYGNKSGSIKIEENEKRS